MTDQIDIDWNRVEQDGGRIHILRCSVCKKTNKTLFDNTGTFKGFYYDGNQFVPSIVGNQKRPFNGKIQTSIMMIWGCKECKGVTYTNCMSLQDPESNQSKITSIE